MLRPLLCVLALLWSVPTQAADWYTGARQAAPTDDWIVTADASVDITTQGSYFGGVQATGALTGTLDQSGFRVRAEGIGGRYQYFSTDVNQTIHGTQVVGSALVGYQWVSPNLSFMAYLGGDARENHLSTYDPANPVNGMSFGAKTVLELYATPTPRTMVGATASYATNETAYFARLRAGYLIGPGLYIGPEALALGDAFFNQERIGAHLTGLQAGPIQFAFAAGYLYDRVRGSGGYGTLDARVGF